MDAHDRNDLDRLVQRYLDGDLPGPRATRLFLDAQQDAKLAAEMENYRRLFSVLDGLPRAEPPDGFDERVLATVPYDLYAGAPRKAWPQLVLGSRPLAWLGALGRGLRSGAGAVFAAYLLFLVISHSVLQEAASAAASAVQQGLQEVVRSSASVPVLSTLLRGLSGAWEGAVSFVQSLSRAWGPEVVTVLSGALFGLIVLALFGARGNDSTKERHV